MQNRKVQKRVIESRTCRIWFLRALVILQILVWCWTVLSKPYFMDNDVSKLAYHVIEMWKNQTLVIPDWIYMTTGEWDCAALFAIPLYGLTKNITLAIAISNCMNIILFSAIVWELLHFAYIQEEYANLTLLLLLIPYNWGMLEYANMLFFSGEQYIYKVLIPIWLIALYQVPKRYHKHLLNLIQIISWFVLLTLTAFSSGLFVFVSSLIAILICRIVEIAVRGKSSDLYSLFLTCLTIVGTFAGIVLQKLFGIVSRSEAMDILASADIWPNIGKMISEIFNVWGVFAPEPIAVLSIGALVRAMKFALVLTVIAATLHNSHYVFYVESALREAKDDFYIENKMLKAELVSVFWCNMILVYISKPSSRYLLAGILSAMLLLGIIADETMGSPDKKLITKCFVFGGAVYLSMLSLVMWKDFHEYLVDSFGNYAKEIISYADTYNADTVIFVNDLGRAEIVRVFDTNRNYVTYHDVGNIISDRDTYARNADRINMTDRNLLVATNYGVLKQIPEYMQVHYAEVGRIGEPGEDLFSKIYFSETNDFDSIAGLNGGEHGLDYPLSYGYSYRHGLLVSPVLEPEDSDYLITIAYSVTPRDGICGELICYQNEFEVGKYPVYGYENSISIKAEKQKTVSFRLEPIDGIDFSVKEIRFDAQNS